MLMYKYLGEIHELDRDSTVAKNAHVQNEGKRKITKNIIHLNSDGLP